MKRAHKAILAVVFAAAAAATSWARAEVGPSRSVKPLSKEWQILAGITGFHSVVHRRSRVAVRILEADGSSTVAQNPVALYVVASNQLSGQEAVDYVWRLPRSVAGVRAVAANDCGVDVDVDVDATDEQGSVTGQLRREVRLCMIRKDGRLESELKVEELPAAATRRPPK
jgi:hypothetical protein